MHFVIIDDVSIQRTLIEDRIAEVCGALGLEWSIALSTEKCQAVEDFAAVAPPDTVYLLDIQLEDEKNGIQLRRSIHELDPDGYIVYVSAYEQYALECCRSHAFDFLLKPWTSKQLMDCLRAIHQDMLLRSAAGSASPDSHITVTMGSRILQLRQEDVLYLSKEHNNVTYHLRDGGTLQCRTSFGRISRQLQPGRFLQIHKSYIVQLSAIREINWSDGSVCLTAGVELPVSRRRAGELRAALGAEGRSLAR